jgi:hypothetical protein
MQSGKIGDTKKLGAACDLKHDLKSLVHLPAI